MAPRNFGRTQQMWVVIAGCLSLFAFFLWLVPGMNAALFWRVLLAGLAATAIAGGVWQVWLTRSMRGRESSVKLLDRITGGDLSLSAREIDAAAHSEQMSFALRALVANLERTIRRFGQLATDVAKVSDQMSGRSRILARSASDQLASTETTSSSVMQIDQSINSVRTSMEELSANAEETSTSVLQMSASIEEVSRIADTLSDFVEQTSSAILEMIASINEVATNTESFSSFATQTASSMVEMNATTDEIGKSARQSAELARYVKDAANEGREAVGGTVDGMRKIQQAVEEAKAALTDLAERSQEIGEIVRVIDEIAGQTNLLALNAAIIAAQAGERGKGFAVVADEIRDLSERTSVSTDEIRTLIENVQRGVARAAEQMNLSGDRVSDGVGLTNRASVVLEKILDLTDRSTNSISEIARATEEQARGSRAATAAIEEVTKMVQQTAAATQQQSQTSRKIGEQAATVRDYTKHLKRAMGEQEHGSRAISKAMENVMGLVQNVLESTSVLASESSAIVKSMEVISRGSREASFGVSDLNQMANTLSHESTLLKQEVSRFALPIPDDGGRVTTATVLWQKLTFDPIHISAAALGFMSRAVHANLVQYGEGAELIPGLAERWEVLEQGTLYRFHLRHGVRFHNGRLFEARDVHENFVRLLSPESKSSSDWILRNVVGADEVIAGRTKTLSGVVIRDTHTVDVHLDEPVAFFLSLLTMNEMGIVATEEGRDPERMRLKPAGAGPFKVEEATEGQRVRLRRNEGYWVPGIPHVDELEFRLDLRSGRDVADAFLRGELDVAHGIPLKIANELRNDPRYAAYMLTTVQLHTSYFGYDSSTAPFDRVEVRQAVNYALNRTRFNEVLYSGLGVLAQSLLPPGLLGYDPELRGYPYDPDKARSLLRQAGYASGFSVEYRTWETDEFNNSGLVPLIIEDLAAIGIQVNVTRHTATEARAPLDRRGHGNVFCGNWFADFPDPDNFFYVFFHSESGAVRGFYFHRDDVDRQILEARRTNDIERRAEIYRDLDRMVVNDAPLAPLFHERMFVLHRPEVRGVRTSLVPPAVRYYDVWRERSSFAFRTTGTAQPCPAGGNRGMCGGQGPRDSPLHCRAMNRARVHLALFAVAILFSLNYIISKLGMHAFDPVSFAFLRVVGSAIVLNVLLRDTTPLSGADKRRHTGLAFLGVVVNQTLFLAGLSMTSAHVAAILITTIPVFTLAAAIVIGQERATLLKVAGIAIAAAGALLVVWGEGFEGTRRSLLGATLIIGNCLSYSLYLVVSKPMMARLTARRVLGRIFALAAVVMLPIAAVPLARLQWSAIPPRAWLALAIVIAGPTVLAYLMNAWALAHADSSLVAAYTYVQPVLTTILAAVFLAERIRGVVLIAAVMIFAGVFMSGLPMPPAAREESVPGNPD
jgi:methyl-accepting chemotaxis protein/ABC-type transport system substrate-binding protein/drug/metabolite transporter (DMT)-like permease